eukprot:TRINITY_DN94234_c0_g1_i1.p1 TRINITY_DN94234_c0_g1~~TRINITY_DN94234_c0_g1_i1.p1  ORF type:complete len:304 (-),score=16.95 TRINITY_DN94234_c0_g1_i1:187-1047(-)
MEDESADAWWVIPLEAACAMGPLLSALSCWTLLIPAYRAKQHVHMPPLSIISAPCVTLLWLIFVVGFRIEFAIGLNAALLLINLVSCCLYLRTYLADDYRPELVKQLVFFGTVALLWLLLGGVNPTTRFPTDPAFDLDRIQEEYVKKEGFYMYVQATAWAAAALGTVLMSHPVFVIIEVIRTHNVDKMGSTSMNIIFAAGALAWLSHGLLVDGSLQVISGNGIAFFVNCLALAVRARARILLPTASDAGCHVAGDKRPFQALSMVDDPKVSDCSLLLSRPYCSLEL